MTTLVRGRVLHTPRPGTLEAFDDGAVAFDDDDVEGRILATGPYAIVRAVHPGAAVSALPGAIVLPGLVDTHVHFPQVSIVGSMGLRLLEWLHTRTLPEEARVADEAVARATARRFLARLLANGTTTALVFGSHFPRAQEVFFEEALASGLRITSGLVVSDRELLPALHATPAAAHAASAALMAAWHGRGRLRYGDPAVLALVHRGDARGLPGGARPRGRRLPHLPSQREPGRDPRRRRAVPVGARLPRHL